MRIVSNFHDYYDIGMGLGHDAELAYIRTSRDVLLQVDRKGEIPEDRITRDLARRLPPIPDLREHNCHVLLIGFIGVFQPVIIFMKEGRKQKRLCYYSLEEVDKCMQVELNTRELKRYEGNSKLVYKYSFRYRVQTLFQKYAALPELTEPFIVNRSPIVVMMYDDITTHKAVWNARLRDYNFGRIIEPYQAFQRIEMFLGNLSTPEKPIPPRTDIEKVQSHGMDPKWSFRKKGE